MLPSWICWFIIRLNFCISKYSQTCLMWPSVGTLKNDWLMIFGVLCHFQQYFSYIMATSFSDGRSRSTWKCNKIQEMQCKGKSKLSSHNASYCLTEVGAKASLTVPLIFPNFMSLGHGNLWCVRQWSRIIAISTLSFSFCIYLCS